MFYEAGVEEFLSLTKYAECVVTNSLHGTIFAVQYSKPLCVFSREQCDTKIKELLALFGLTDHMLVSGAEDKGNLNDINYEVVHSRIAEARKKSLEFLRYSGSVVKTKIQAFYNEPISVAELGRCPR